MNGFFDEFGMVCFEFMLWSLAIQVLYIIFECIWRLV